MSSNQHHIQTPREELANTITHGIGAAFAIAALSVAVTFASLRGDVPLVVGASIYGASLVILYLASTFYHLVQEPRAKRFFHFFDHAAIYLLIAGTYTPFTLVTLRGPLGWTLFGLIWGFAVVGICFKVFLTGRLRAFSLVTYIGMGWLALIALKPLFAALPTSGLWLVIGGGLSYTFGTIFFVWRRLPYNHAVWHLFVLGGSGCHFFAILIAL